MTHNFSFSVHRKAWIYPTPWELTTDSVWNWLTLWNFHKMSFLFKAPAASAMDVWTGLLLLISFTSGIARIQKSVIFSYIMYAITWLKGLIHCSNSISNSPVTRKQALSSVSKFGEWTDFLIIQWLDWIITLGNQIFRINKWVYGWIYSLSLECLCAHSARLWTCRVTRHKW